jgi:hypothetical protein
MSVGYLLRVLRVDPAALAAKNYSQRHGAICRRGDHIQWES